MGAVGAGILTVWSGKGGGEVVGVRYYSLEAIKVDSFTPGQEGVGQDDGF